LAGLIYNFSIRCFIALVKLASLFNGKARAFADGRSELFQRLEETFSGRTDRTVWIHCASLGEFEQGRPIMESLRSDFPNHKILLTFFSPSGYEVRKNYPGADYVFYFPFDLPKSAKRFINIAKPAAAIFIKYEFWANFYFELRKQNIPIISVSSIFREDQIFFKSYGGFMRSVLQTIGHFFVQNQESARLLEKIGQRNVTVSGDTRFDRVYQITQNQTENTVAKKFKDSKPCWVVGSCWPADMDLLVPFINASKGKQKFILAPHEISEGFLQSIIDSLDLKSVRYSQPGADVAGADVLIVDNVGLLSQLYRYGEYAFVGGGFSKGLHNILEPACFGIPVFFGNKNYKKFREAVGLIQKGGAFAVANIEDLNSIFKRLSSDTENYSKACQASQQYVEENRGATEKIMAYLGRILK
jgi:3-deoxy-D-manno-octulosonic-acid transferase